LPLKHAESAFYEELFADTWRSFIGKAGEGMTTGLRELGDRLQGEVSTIKRRLSKPPLTILHGDYRLDNCFFPEDEGLPPFVVIDWEFCARGRGPYDVAAFISEAFPAEQRRAEEMGLLRTYHATLEANGVTGYSFEECVEDYRFSMLEIIVFWIVSGGYCEYEGERATTYLHNSLARFHSAVEDLRSADLLLG
jgi:thiamine kinase-like enzyme